MRGAWQMRRPAAGAVGLSWKRKLLGWGCTHTCRLLCIEQAVWVRDQHVCNKHAAVVQSWYPARRLHASQHATPVLPGRRLNHFSFVSALPRTGFGKQDAGRAERWPQACIPHLHAQETVDEHHT